MSAPDWQSRGSPVADDPAAPAPPDRHRRTTRLFAHPARAFILSGCPPRMNHRPASVATEFFNSLLEHRTEKWDPLFGLIRCSIPLAGASVNTENRVHFSVRRARAVSTCRESALVFVFDKISTANRIPSPLAKRLTSVISTRGRW